MIGIQGIYREIQSKSFDDKSYLIKKGKSIGWLNKIDDDRNFAPDAIYIAGLPEYKYKDLVHMIVDETNKQITFTGNNRFNRRYRPDVILSFDKLIGAEFVTERQLKDASIIGGAIIGNVLFSGKR